MKNRGLGFVFGFLLSMLSLSSVSALTLDNISRGISDVFGWIFGFLLNTTNYDIYFFEKILFLFILFLLIRVALETLPPLKNKLGVINIISVAVSLIAVRYLTELDIVKGILIPYGTLATALLIILPFIVFGFFIYKTFESGTARKAAWIFYMIVLLGIWWNASSNLSNLENYIYVAILILAICLFLFDRRVKEHLGRSEAKKSLNAITEEQVGKLLQRYYDRMDLYGKTGQKKWLDAADKIRQQLLALGHRVS